MCYPGGYDGPDKRSRINNAGGVSLVPVLDALLAIKPHYTDQVVIKSSQVKHSSPWPMRLRKTSLPRATVSSQVEPNAPGYRSEPVIASSTAHPDRPRSVYVLTSLFSYINCPIW